MQLDIRGNSRLSHQACYVTVAQCFQCVEGVHAMTAPHGAMRNSQLLSTDIELRVTVRTIGMHESALQARAQARPITFGRDLQLVESLAIGIGQQLRLVCQYAGQHNPSPDTQACGELIA